ncbi:sensor histidine kinase [Piscinibacter sakaiensis]|uniref:Oxygen sensor histidine kinase NreB n=1 Tax=Piscinibacter sakaiensis TaxID=1547922 RepID=A0A0K8NTI2_PISS1|nr:histidine kinase [Piscinibacter sakaiensis]GAP33721.1 hypothetical protein ISF6_0974 [Piscinibacter sakaiensis]
MAASSTPTPTSARPGPAERTRRRDAAGDALAVGLFTGLVWLVAGRFDFLERYLRLTGRLEHWQVDELVFATTAFVLGLTWVALRRWREALRASAMHQAAEQRVAELLAHNRELAQQLISVQEAERRALARELHDEVGQICSAIRVEAALVDRSGAAEPAARAAAQRIEAAADALHQTVRAMLRRLRPADLDALGLRGAIQALCERWETRSGIACVFHHAGPAAAWDALDDAVGVACYRVAQEALSNVVRHARASHVRLALQLRPADADGPGELALSVQDDGAGLDPRRGSGGLGLLGAGERAALLGGALAVDGAPGQGCTLRWRVPLSPGGGVASPAAPAAAPSLVAPSAPAPEPAR